MTEQSDNSIDLSALIDIISNMAGMMILLACVAVLVNRNVIRETTDDAVSVKSISFPLAYVPEKRSLTLCLKYDRLYTLPERALLTAVTERAKAGEPVQSLRLTENGVDSEIVLTPTLTGFRFQYKLLPDGGLALGAADQTVEILDTIVAEFPADRYFFVFHTWPECFPEFRDIREYLFERGVEVGWSPRTDDPESYDIVYSMGEYDETLSTIKAQ